MRDQVRRPRAVPRQVERVGRLVIVHAVGHVDDRRLGVADVLPAMVELGGMMSRPGLRSLTSRSFNCPRVGESGRPSNTANRISPETTNSLSVLRWCRPQARTWPGRVVVIWTWTTGAVTIGQSARTTSTR